MFKPGKSNVTSTFKDAVSRGKIILTDKSPKESIDEK